MANVAGCHRLAQAFLSGRSRRFCQMRHNSFELLPLCAPIAQVDVDEGATGIDVEPSRLHCAKLALIRKTRRPTTIQRPVASGKFVIGCNSFAKISAVEKISPSARLQDDLHRLRNAAPDDRRATLKATYGKH